MASVYAAVGRGGDGSADLPAPSFAAQESGGFGAHSMSESEGSASSSLPYESLLAHTAQLQGDLHAAVGACKALKVHNDALRSAYEKLKNEFIQLKTQYEEARKQVLAEAEAKFAVERSHEALMREWRAQLDARAQELEQMQARLAPPRDLEQLKVQIADELAAGHNAKLSALQRELEAVRIDASARRREYEALRTEYEAFAADQNREAEVTMEAHRAEKAQLHATIAKLEATIDEGNAVSERAVRTARADVETKTARIAALEHELEAVRNSAEEARCAAEEERLRYQREAAEWTSRLARATVEAESADRRRASAEVQAGSLSASYAALSATASRQSQELATARERGANDLSTARAQIADAESRASAAQRETASVRANMQAALERAREEAVRAADAARHEQAELKRKLRDAQAARVAAEQRVHVITRQLTRQKRDALTDATRRTGGMGTAAAGGVGDTTTVSGLLTGQSTPATREDDDYSDEGALAMALLSTDMTGDVGGDYERTLTLALQKTNEAAALKRSLKEQTEQVHALRAELEAARRSVTTAEEARAAAEGRATVAETALTAERADAAASQTALQQLQRTVEERRVEVVKLTADCAALREAGATAVRMAVAKEREAAVSTMETVLRKKEGYKKALITSRTKVSALKQETAVLDEQCKALAAELAEVRRTKDALLARRDADLLALRTQLQAIARVGGGGGHPASTASGTAALAAAAPGGSSYSTW